MSRDLNGRFAKGNPGGPGRPPRAVELDYLVALRDGVSLADWAKVIGRALEDALSGDHRAREWLAKYLLPTDPALLAAVPQDVKDKPRTIDELYKYWGAAVLSGGKKAGERPPEPGQ